MVRKENFKNVYITFVDTTSSNDVIVGDCICLAGWEKAVETISL